MTRVALLRAVNVGGRAVVKMADVRAAFERAGCRDVRSVGHAGNVLFTADDKDAIAQQKKIVSAMQGLIGATVEICFRTLDEITALVHTNPFGDLVGDGSLKLYVTFMDRQPRRCPELPMTVPKEAIEVIAVRRRELFIVSRRKPNGMYGFPNAIVESLGVVATSRNWNTVMKLVRDASAPPDGTPARRKRAPA